MTDGCSVSGELDYSVLFENVTVEQGAKVEYSLVMPGAVIKKGAHIKYSIIAENVTVEENAVIGAEPAVNGSDDWGITVIGDGLSVGKNSKIGPKLMITENVKDGEIK